MNAIQFSGLIFFLFMMVGIFATPTNDFLEITAHLCHLSESKERCYCLEAGKRHFCLWKSAALDKKN